MWPFRGNVPSGDVLRRSEVAATILIVIANESAPYAVKELVGEERADASGELISPITLELLILGLHLTDRMAFSKLGAANRTVFVDALLPAVQRQLNSALQPRVEALYNTRNMFYGGFRNLYPDKAKNEILKGTLFWEFGKSLGAIYANSNPIAITQVSALGMTIMQSVVDSYEKMKVFS